jgi:hypothetical protein
MRAVETVSQEEANNGASQSDVIRLASRDQERNGEQVPMSVYLSRAAQFRAQLKKPKTEEQPKPECPVEKARAESQTGENAPLNWLVADHFGGQADFAPTGNDVLVTESKSKEPSADEFTCQPTIASESGSLLSGEWLLSPCA